MGGMDFDAGEAGLFGQDGGADEAGLDVADFG